MYGYFIQHLKRRLTVHACMYVCVLYIRTCMYLLFSRAKEGYIETHIHNMHNFVCVCIGEQISHHKHTCVYIHTYVYAYVYCCISEQVYHHKHTCVYIHTYIHTYIRVLLYWRTASLSHTHTHVYVYEIVLN